MFLCPSLLSDASSILEGVGSRGEVIRAAFATSNEHVVILVTTDDVVGASSFRVRRFRRTDSEVSSVIFTSTEPEVSIIEAMVQSGSTYEWTPNYGS